MKEHYVTLFNSKFLPQGLTLLKSMQVHLVDFNLWILCLDSDTFNILKKLNLKSISLLLLEDFETEDLLIAKKNRTFTEYCWTLTPFSFKFVHKVDPTIKRLTYIDADMFFFNNPRLIFSNFEKSKKSILITKHNYSPFYDHSRTSGKFCVQFLTIDFENGEKVRKDWEEKCLYWCFNRFEDGKFGDQKYLDSWPFDFEDLVYIVENKENFLAPWNISHYSLDDIVLYHFHGLRILRKNRFFIGNYLIPNFAYNYLYTTYLHHLKKSITELEDIDFKDYVQQENTFILKLKSILSFPYFIIKLIKHKHIIKYD